MITYHKDYGCWFQMTEDSKHYALYEAKSYKHKSTSDRVIIWDEDNDEMVNFVYGATLISIEELDKYVSEYVAEYEAKAKATPKKIHPFTRAGVKAFEDQASTEFFAKMDEQMEWPFDLSAFDIVVSCGKHQVSIPLGAEEWDALYGFLRFCLEVNE